MSKLAIGAEGCNRFYNDSSNCFVVHTVLGLGATVRALKSGEKVCADFFVCWPFPVSEEMREKIIE